ncbi:MAG TPA: hypothetical protein VNO26_10745 [Candidatus Limnocylindria bacterium]|nr:hypothetical protein [Candidatus Limnocylindria bacterium]
MDLAFGIEMVIGLVLLFGGGAWFFTELEGLGDRQRRFESVFMDFLFLGAPMGMVALFAAAIGGYILWNGINGGPLLLDPDRLRPWIPDRF